jgi:hypothetical protein
MRQRINVVELYADALATKPETLIWVKASASQPR